MSLDQLGRLGVRRGAIDHRLACGRLVALHRGVFAVGHAALTQGGRWMAAVLAAGPGAVLSHRAAAALSGIRHTDAVEVTAPRRRRARAGVLLHAATIAPDERTMVDGIPVTTVARTLLDLAAVLSYDQLRRAAHEAEARQLAGPLSLEALLERHAGRRGTANLRRLLTEEQLGSETPKSVLEARFIDLVRRAGLPGPRVGLHLHAGGRLYEADCSWPGRRLLVELDGRRFHARNAAFEADGRRDRELTVAGWHTVRVTWRQLHAEPGALVRDLRALLDTG